jgi:hypothetical protein
MRMRFARRECKGSCGWQGTDVIWITHAESTGQGCFTSDSGPVRATGIKERPGPIRRLRVNFPSVSAK